jgi:hypothetical protein
MHRLWKSTVGVKPDNMVRYRPLRGSSYIPLPIKLRTKRAIINVKNKDNKCFMWSVLAVLYPPQRDSERI